MAEKRLQRTRDAYRGGQIAYSHDYRCALPYGRCNCGADERNGVTTQPLSSWLVVNSGTKMPPLGVKILNG